MIMLSETLMAAILLVFFLYLSLHPGKIRRRQYFVLGWGGLKLIVIALFFLIRHNPDVMVVAQVLTYIGLLLALGGAAGAIFPGRLPLLESAEPPAPAEVKEVPNTPSQQE